MKFKKYLTEKTKYTIYVDMDGVLTDFVRQTEETFGVKFDTLLNNDSLFWELIRKAGEPYWSEMPMMKDAKKLMNYMKDENVKILSSAGSPRNEHKDTISGKLKWMKKHFPNIPVIIEYEKYKYADENSILIDDLKKNIDPWIKHGGIGILHTDANSTIKKLKSYGI